MTLDEIAAQESHLLSLIPPHGYFEERAPQVEAAGLPERWQEVFASYLELVGHDPDGLEALTRAVFIAWYSYNEPWQLTGIRDLPPAQVVRVLKDLDSRMDSGSCDSELLSMLRGYGPGLPFDLYPELNSLNSFLNSIEGTYSPDTPLRPMEDRGALGTYWLSRNDVTFRQAADHPTIVRE